MAEAERQAVQALNERLAAVTPYKLDLVDPNEVKLLDKNARFMDPKTFHRLVDNLKHDGGLQGVPFCWKMPEGHYLVLSGNHRVKSARAAGLEQILIMYSDAPLTEAERVSIQLAHNAITGQDNMQMLQELWDSIADLDMKQYSGLETTDFDKLPSVSLDSIKEEPLEFENVAFVFTAQDREVLENALDAAGKNDAIYVSDRRDFDKWFDGLLDVKATVGIRNTAAALMVMVEVFTDHLGDLAHTEKWQERTPEDDKGWVPLRAIFGSDRVPRPVAKMLVEIVGKLERSGDVTEKNRWQVLEYLAADHMAGE